MTTTYGFNFKQFLVPWEESTVNHNVVDYHEHTLIVGNLSTTDSSGSVYVYSYEDPGCNLWLDAQCLRANDAKTLDYFGNSVSLNKNYILIGAYGDDTSGSSAGAAYIFTSSAGIWSEHQKIAAYDGTADDLFGYSVSIHPTENILAVSARDAAPNVAGLVYIFTGSDDGKFYCSQCITNTSGASGTAWHFGTKIKLTGSWLAIGHGGYPQFFNDNSLGAVWLYHNNGLNYYNHNQSILGSDYYAAGSDANMGAYSFSINDNFMSVPINPPAGSLTHCSHVFKNIDGIWTYHSYIDFSQIPSGWGAQQNLVSSVYKPADYTNDNDLFAICGYMYSDPHGLNSGCVVLYRYNINLSRWVEKLILTGSDVLSEWGNKSVIISGSNDENFDIIFPTEHSIRINVYGITASFVQPITCQTPLIDSNFTLNHYICLPTNYTNTEGERSSTVPFSYKYRPHFHISGSWMRAK